MTHYLILMWGCDQIKESLESLGIDGWSSLNLVCVANLSLRDGQPMTMWFGAIFTFDID